MAMARAVARLGPVAVAGPGAVEGAGAVAKNGVVQVALFSLASLFRGRSGENRRTFSVGHGLALCQLLPAPEDDDSRWESNKEGNNGNNGFRCESHGQRVYGVDAGRVSKPG